MNYQHYIIHSEDMGEGMVTMGVSFNESNEFFWSKNMERYELQVESGLVDVETLMEVNEFIHRNDNNIRSGLYQDTDNERSDYAGYLLSERWDVEDE